MLISILVVDELELSNDVSVGVDGVYQRSSLRHTDLVAENHHIHQWKNRLRKTVDSLREST